MSSRSFRQRKRNPYEMSMVACNIISNLHLAKSSNYDGTDFAWKTEAKLERTKADVSCICINCLLILIYFFGLKQPKPFTTELMVSLLI